MSKNIFQVYQDNPIVTNQSTDLMYFGRSPYGIGDDAAMQFSDFAAQFGAAYTPAALTKTDDTNVTMTLGGSPSTALLNAASMTLGWSGQLSVPRGGTAASSFTAYSVICGGTTATGALQSVIGLGNAGEQLTSNGAGALPTWQPSSGITPAALTKVDDTNVTLTLGGSPGTALLQATSITAGWAGQLSLARGGTNKNITPDNGALVYCDADSFELLAATATAGQIPRSGANSAPTWSTATYPATAGTSGNVLASDGTNWVSTAAAGIGSPLTTKGDLYTYSTVNTRLAVGTTNGQMLQVSSGAATGLSWSTATYPSTVTANNILYASGSNVVGQLTPGTGVITALGQNVTGSGGIVLATSPTITTPTMQEINGSLLNRVLLLQDTASAVNSFIFSNSATGNSPTLTASGSDTNVALTLQGTGTSGVPIKGVSTNSSAAAGYVGEIISSIVSSGSAVSLSTGSPSNITSIVLTAGDWDIWSSIAFVTAATTSVTQYRAGICATSATFGLLVGVAETQIINNIPAFVPGVSTSIFPIGTVRVTTTGTTYYLVGQSTFTISTMSAYGSLIARRRR